MKTFLGKTQTANERGCCSDCSGEVQSEKRNHARNEFVAPQMNLRSVQTRLSDSDANACRVERKY